MTDSLRCPRDRTELAAVRSPGWRTYRCARCEGVAVTLAVLRKFVPPGRLRDLWMLLPAAAGGDPCPACSMPLTATSVPASPVFIDLDACRACQLIWFDARELVRFSPERQEPPRTPAQFDVNADLSPAAREAMALAGMEAERLGDKAVHQAWIVLLVLSALFGRFPIWWRDPED